MSGRTRYVVWLIGLALLDVLIPIPVAAALLIYVVVRRPRWFFEFVSDLYSREV